MVGNDLVDLRDRDADPRTLSPRFDQRVFDEAEREQLAASGSPVRLRWTLWAAKEAAYKLVVKLDPEVIFSPSRFRVRLEDDARSAVVEVGRHAVPVRILEDAGAIHAVATTSATPPLAGIRRLGEAGRTSPEELGLAVRRLAVLAISRSMGVDPGDVEIRKRGRVPEVFARGRRAPADLSLAHHGDVVGFAFELFQPRSRDAAGSFPASARSAL